MDRKHKASLHIVFGLAILLAATVFISPANREPLVLQEKPDTLKEWQYLPGDLPYDDKGLPDFESADGRAWKRVNESNPSAGIDTDVLWMRYKLPEAFQVYNPAFFLQFDFPVEVYISGQKIYSYGSMGDRDRIMIFQHLIPLLDNYRGEMLYFRYPVKEDLKIKDLEYLAGWETVSRDEKARELVFDDLRPVALCIVELFLGLVLIVVAATQIHRQKTEAKLLVLSGTFILLDSVNILTCLYIIKTALKQPVLLFYIDYATYFSTPYVAGAIIYYISELKYKSLLRILNRIFMLFLASVLLLSCIPGFDISRADYVFNTCLIAYVILIFCLLVKELIGGKKELRILLAGMITAVIFGFIDVLNNLNIIELTGYVSNIGVFILALSMAYFFGSRYTKLYDGIQLANKQLLKSKEYIEEVNRELDRKVIEKTAAIRNLFDNAEQGFLSFGRDLAVASEYSYKCFEIFGFDISGASFPALVSSNDVEQGHFLESAFFSIFNEQDYERREVYISLLPDELILNDRVVSADYKLIDNDSHETETVCMVILTDITEKRQLELKLQEEQTVLNMAVKVIAGYNDFVDIMNEYKEFYKTGITGLLASGAGKDCIFREIFRTIHTYKGAFGQFGMINTAAGLHDIESKMQALKQKGFDVKDIETLCGSCSFEGFLKKDTDILADTLGDKYINSDRLVIVEESKVKDMKDRIAALISPEDREAVLREFESFEHRSLKEMLEHYPGYCVSLGERYGKLIKDFEIKGQDIMVNPKTYSTLCKALGHIFRNIADHGIEFPDQRMLSGKDECGNVACELGLNEKNIFIMICDDGAGIDTETVKSKAVQDGILSVEEAAAASDDELIPLIFNGSFSTREEVTDLSGRGMGLSAVKAEVERLSGSIKVESVKGRGTCFSIAVPLID